MLGALAAAGGLSLVSGAIGASGAKKASKAQQTAILAAENELRNGAVASDGRLKDYYDTNQDAMGRLSDILLNGDASGFYTSPGYQYRQDEGQKVIDSSAAAGGRLFSGRTMQELQAKGQDIASQEFGNYLNQVGGLYNSTAGNAATFANLPYDLSQNIANLKVAGGNAKAQGIQGQTNAWTGAIGNIAGFGGQASGAGMFGGGSVGMPYTGGQEYLPWNGRLV